MTDQSRALSNRQCFRMHFNAAQDGNFSLRPKITKMTNGKQIQPASGMSLGDVYYVIFRHKGKIMLFSLMGILAAAALFFLKPPPYQSQAELLIQYVSQARALSLVGSDQKVFMPDSRGDDIINSEIQILTSLDLATAAVGHIGASNILAGAGLDNARKAAALVQDSLKAVPANSRSSVIVVTFQHPDARVVQPVLLEIINDYFQRHYEIHSAAGQYDEILNREQSSLSAQLSETEQQLLNLKNKAGILSIDDSKKDLSVQIAKIQGAILDAQAELAGYGEYEAVVKLDDKKLSQKLTITNNSSSLPLDQLDLYNDVCTRLDLLRKKKQGYMVQGFTSGNVLVQEVSAQVVGEANAKEGLEKKYPQIREQLAASLAENGIAVRSAIDFGTQITPLAALLGKLKIWKAQLDQLQMQATHLNSLAPTLAQLEQRKEIQAANYQYLATKLKNFHIDESLTTGKAPNIKWVQMPSPPYQDWTKALKRVAAVAFGGIMAGLAWAFLTELYLDGSVKRPGEIQAKLKLPLFLSIPSVTRKGDTRLDQTATQRLQFNDATESVATASSGALQVVSLELNPSLQPFYEALRDRLIVYFEVKNLTHKPKLVAMTSANQGAGVSTLAAGLAASLSETGEGRVLLVDMNLENGAAQQFYKGRADCGLDAALKNETRDNALIQENLYVVTEDLKSDKLQRILPHRFAALVPKFKASDFDYIIFDLPPVSQTSITSRLARFMDMVLLVVESEKTSLGVVQQANSWLAESGATVGAVLNKTRAYVPAQLHQDFLNSK